ncbi:Fe(3+)-citrate import system permease protein yfmD [Ketogulonicigenium vulgare Y25]|nr:Fe(3+)-citrate import system permease protein yfmD [Ketogulonicigenium vulgare Y25]
MIGLVVILTALAWLFFLSIGIGARPIPLPEVWRALIDNDGSRNAIIVWQLRIPRTLLGLLVGIALGLSGAVMQALTRNPLAAPGLLGINAGAALMVVLAISMLGINSFPGYVWFALVGCGGAAALVYTLSGRSSSAVQQVRLVLAGAAITSPPALAPLLASSRCPTARPLIPIGSGSWDRCRTARPRSPSRCCPLSRSAR